MKKKGIGSEARAERMAIADTDLQLLNKAEKGRQLLKQKKRRLQGREDEVCYDFDLYFLSSTYSRYVPSSELSAKQSSFCCNHLWDFFNRYLLLTLFFSSLFSGCIMIRF